MPAQTDQRAKELLQQQGRMRTNRTMFDQTWQDIAERIVPRMANFLRPDGNQPKGRRLTEKIFDAAPALALDRFAASAHSLVIPRNQVWQRFKASNEELNKDIEVQRYFDQLTKVVFAARYAGNFDNQAHECFYSLGGFGNMVLYTGDTGTKLLYRAVPMWQAYFAENQYGVVDALNREYWLTARQAVEAFGRDQVANAVSTAYERTPEVEFPYLCVVRPRNDMDVGRKDFRGMPFVQFEIDMTSSAIVKEEGYRAFPYAIGRYSVTPGEIYGRGPAELVLPDVKQLNTMSKTVTQAAQLKMLPPLLAHRDGILDAYKMTPAAINYGGVDDQARPKVVPLQVGGDTGLTLELMDQKRGVIQDAFWGKMFQVLLENPQMTATQAMLIAQQQGALLAPTASRIESEFLARVSEREIEILHKAGVLPQPPRKLLEAGGGYQIEYDSPMSRARRAEEGVSILRSFEQLTPMAQAPGGQDVFKRVKWDEVSKTIFEVNGAPAKILYTDDEMVAVEAGAQQQANLQQILAAAPVAASAAKDLASAQSIAASSPNQTAVPAAGIAPS